ncbi:MAG: hypothetical protein M9894_03705 [Planctomycetes bacterium]|nr:hypothetical protein [Planctomycetota bacterium]
MRLLPTTIAVLALAAPALALDPRVPVLGREARAEDKVAGFRRAHATDAALIAALDAADGAAARDRIHLALLADPLYAAAYAEFERAGDNADRWRGVLEKLPKAARYHRAHATYFLGRALLAQDDLEGAALAFEAVRGRQRGATPWSDDATLYLASIYARLPGANGSQSATNRGRARQLVDDLLARDGRLYPEAPERVREGARWLERELRGEGSGPLLELAKRMETIERLIRRTHTDQPTQERQREVVVALDKLIELMREKENDGSCEGGGQGQKPGQKPGQARGNQRSGNPAQESTLPQGDGREGPLTEGPRGPAGDSWGDLPDRERDEALQFLRERFPSRYREIIEGYYRALSEEGGR